MKGIRPSTSLRTQLITLVCLFTILPFGVGQLISYRQTTTVIEENMREQSIQNVTQMQKTLDATLSSYEDLLFQLYTDDGIVDLVNKLVEGTDVAVSSNQLRRAIHGKAYAKPYLQAITVLFDGGATSSYDKLTASATRSSWIDAWDKQAMFDLVSSSNDTHYFSTAYAMPVMGEKVYLFHIAHRIIDYRHVDRRYAVVILSVDETLLRTICNEAWQNGREVNAFHVLTDAQGIVLSAPKQEMIGQQIAKEDGNGLRFAKNSQLLSGDGIASNVIEMERTGWTLYCFQNQTELFRQLSHQQTMMGWMMAASLVTLVAAVALLIRLLTRSVDVVSRSMQKAASGDLTVRIPDRTRMPRETAIIAQQFNVMMDDIATLMENVKIVTANQHDAELAMLEAQINPHFLYNTLDTINWMAIDHDAFDVSNAITALARILRYGIESISQIVTVREETEWLKQYLTLQQLRLKNTLITNIDVEESALALPVHKLLFQPFVENAVLHGFDGVKHTHELSIEVKRVEHMLHISISDNGKGMTQAQCDSLLHAPDERDKHHIGVYNAIQRMHLYYGDAADICIRSVPNEGTQITLLLPITQEEQP